MTVISSRGWQLALTSTHEERELSGDPDLNVPDLRTDVPHSARIYDYLLGGKDNISQVVP